MKFNLLEFQILKIDRLEHQIWKFNRLEHRFKKLDLLEYQLIMKKDPSEHLQFKKKDS